MTDEIYKKGEWIVHVNYGVGQVKSKDTKILDGKKNTFLKVKTFSSEYYIPTSNWDVPRIRSLASLYQMKKAVSIIKKPPVPLKMDYKQRGKQIMEALSEISLYSTAEIIRDLHGRKLVGRLTVTEAEILDKTINKFLNEWSVITDQEKEELRYKLGKAFQASLENMKNEKDDSWLERVKKGIKVNVEERGQQINISGI